VSPATATPSSGGGAWEDSLGPYVGAAIDYATDVVEGRQVAGKWTRLACERQLRDLEREGEDFPYVFDCDAASAPCRLIESLPHIEGEWATRGELITLEPWQCFLITTTYGWRHRDTGARRFRTAYWEVARKNAKSTIAAGLALHALQNDGEAGAQVYSAATKKDQAKIVFDHAREMLRRAKGQKAAWTRGIEAHKNVLFVPKTASKFAPLDREASSQDGLNVHTAVNDELHAWKRRDLYAVLESATGSRRQPLIINITTAGFNLGGICYEIRGYGLKILDRVLTDETFMAAVWTLDEGDDPWDEANWPKANPNYGVSVYPLDLEAQARKAKSIASQQTDFFTKRLNIWCSAEASWMDMRRWDACARPDVPIEAFEGQPAIAAFDIAEKRDITARCLLFAREEQGKRHVYAFLRYYLPEDAVRESRNNQYDGWVRRGLITVTDGNIIDLDRVAGDLVEDSHRFSVGEVAYDPHNATSLALELTKAGMRPVEFRQTPMNFDEPMRWWDAMVAEGTFHHNGDPVLTWMVSNVTIRQTGRMHEFLHPRKERVENKIDGAVTVCMALKRLMAEQAGYTIYEERGVVVV
jgi:phage terminase large subunit-like protein